MKRFLILAATVAALCTPLAALAQQPAQWKYRMVDGVATASYPGNVSISGTLTNKESCANILDYGGDNLNAAPNGTAFDLALAASGALHPAQRCVYLPAGTYQFATSKTITAAAGTSSVAVIGDGPDITNLNFSSGSSGLSFSLSDASQSFLVQDLSVLATGYNAATTGIYAVQTVPVVNPAYAAASRITNVVVRGVEGYAAGSAFGKGISMFKNSNVNVSGSYVIGSGTEQGVCMAVEGAATNIAVVFNVTSSYLNGCSTGFYYGTYVQGVSITATNLTGNRTGLYVPPGALEVSQLAIANSQFANLDFDINLQTDPGGTTIASNFFLANADATAGNARINIGAAKNFAIFGNSLQGVSDINAIVVQGYVSPWSSYIGSNTINQFDTGIWLQAGSQYSTVAANSFRGNVTDVINAGSNNIVATTCTAAPTAAFRATNGVITAC